MNLIPEMQPQKESPELQLHREGLNIDKQKIFMETQAMDDQYYLQDKEVRDELLRWQQDLNPDLVDLKHDLKNEVKNENGAWVPLQEKVYDPEKDAWVMKNMEPRMNDRGISFLLTAMKRIVSRNTMRSNLDENTIRKKMTIFGNDLAIAMAVNYDKFGIDMTEYHLLNTTIRNIVHLTLLRALNDGERKNEREIRRLIEAYPQSPGDEAKTKGIKGLFGG